MMCKNTEHEYAINQTDCQLKTNNEVNFDFNFELAKLRAPTNIHAY